MPLQPRPEVKDLHICPHGGIRYAELKEMGIDPEKVLDFSVCTNPYMPPLEIREMMRGIAISKYPDSEATEFRQKLARRLAISAGHLLVGSGTTELIRLVALAYFQPEDKILILEPTYGEYEIAAQLFGTKIMKLWLKAENNFAPKVEETANVIREIHPKVVFLCNPNNPTGKYLTQKEVEIIADAVRDDLIILDEAYLAFVDQSWSSIQLALRGNTIVLRSMTKDYALAGLRLGYAIARQEIIDILNRICPPWNVNVVAQKVGVKLLEDDNYLNQSRQKIRMAKQLLINGLSRLGLSTLPSDTHYFLIKVGNAKTFRARLLKNGIQVRDCTSFGLPQYIRVATRTIPECQKLIDTIGLLKKRGELDDIS